MIKTAARLRHRILEGGQIMPYAMKASIVRKRTIYCDCVTAPSPTTSVTFPIRICEDVQPSPTHCKTSLQGQAREEVYGNGRYRNPPFV
jgi:hypothetical protein